TRREQRIRYYLSAKGRKRLDRNRGLVVACALGALLSMVFIAGDFVYAIPLALLLLTLAGVLYRRVYFPFRYVKQGPYAIRVLLPETMAEHASESRDVDPEVRWTEHPQSLKSAANLLLLISFFNLLIVVGLMALSWGDMDSIGRTGSSVVTGFSLLIALSAILLHLRKPAGKHLWYIISPFVLLQFPIGTILAVCVYLYLRKPDAIEALTPTPPNPA
ncbi:MAG: hypothetical protein AAF492_12380, partial [Verrucomicrobiota bacterium]